MCLGIKRCAESDGNLVGHRHTAPGKPQHHDVRTPAVAVEKPRQGGAGIASITEQSVRLDTPGLRRVARATTT